MFAAQFMIKEKEEKNQMYIFTTLLMQTFLVVRIKVSECLENKNKKNNEVLIFILNKDRNF